MYQLPAFIQSNQVIALFIGSFIFFVTVFLASRKIIGTLFTLLLLIVAIAASLLIGQPHIFPSTHPSLSLKTPIIEENIDFKAQIFQTFNHIQSEITQEKESLQKIAEGMQKMLTQMEAQTQELQSFIEETRERFIKINAEIPQTAPHPNPELTSEI